MSTTISTDLPNVADDEEVDDSDLPHEIDWDIMDAGIEILKERSAEDGAKVEEGLRELDEGIRTGANHRWQLETRLSSGSPMAIDEWLDWLDVTLKLTARVRRACDDAQAVYDRHTEEWRRPGATDVDYLAYHVGELEGDFCDITNEMKRLLMRILYRPLTKRRAGKPNGAIAKDLVVLKLRSVEDYKAVRAMIDDLNARAAKAGQLNSVLNQRMARPLVLSSAEQDFYERARKALASRNGFALGGVVLADMAAQDLRLPALEALVEDRFAAWSDAIAGFERAIHEASPFTLA